MMPRPSAPEHELPILPVTVPRAFGIIAHRGASAYAPENTLSAFLLAERMGAEEIEMDVQLSRDHGLVVVHDESLDRYGHPGLQVSALCKAELLALDMGSWFSPFLYRHERMLSLGSVFSAFCDRFTYHVEIKTSTSELPPKILACASAAGLGERVLITSFHLEMLLQTKSICPHQRVGWLLRAGQFTHENIARAARDGFFQICPRADETTPAMVEAAHRLLPNVRAHNVRGQKEMLQAIESGCDGMTIDWPDWLLHEE